MAGSEDESQTPSTETTKALSVMVITTNGRNSHQGSSSAPRHTSRRSLQLDNDGGKPVDNPGPYAKKSSPPSLQITDGNDYLDELLF